MRSGDNRTRRNLMNRREFLRLTGVGGGTILLVACGASSGSPAAEATQAPANEPTTAPAAEATGEKVSLTFWTPGSEGPFCESFGKIAEAYEKLHTNVDIAEIQCGTGEQSFKEVLLARIAAGNPPDATILWDSPIALSARGSLESLDDLMQTSEFSQVENWPPAVLASCQYGGKTWGLPVAAGTYAMWYNQELFAAKGIPSDRESFPKTWDDLRKLSKEFTHWNGDTLESAGFIPWQDPSSLPIWSASNGSQLYDAANRKYTIDSEENIFMMQYALDWLNEEYKGDITKVNNSGAWGVYPGAQGQPPAFQEGRLATLMEGFWVVGGFYDVEAKFKEWNVAHIPIGPEGTKHVAGYWPNWLVIPKGSKNREEAFKWLDYISGEGIKTWFASVPDMPVNKKVPADLIPALAIEKRGQEFAADVTAFFRGQLDISTPMWDSPVQDFATDQIARAIEKIMNKAASPQDALTEAQQASQAELDRTLKAGA